MMYFYGEKGLCPVCGEPVHLSGGTTDGRLIASCGDAFHPLAWNEDTKAYRQRVESGKWGAKRELNDIIEVKEN